MACQCEYSTTVGHMTYRTIQKRVYSEQLKIPSGKKYVTFISLEFGGTKNLYFIPKLLQKPYTRASKPPIRS